MAKKNKKVPPSKRHPVKAKVEPAPTPTNPVPSLLETAFEFGQAVGQRDDIPDSAWDFLKASPQAKRFSGGV